MIEKTYTVSTDRKPEIERLIRSLPAMLSGRAPDPLGIARGMKARVGWTFFSLVAFSFEQKGRGQIDDAGEFWAPLSEKYLAYQRPVTGKRPPRAGGLAPGGKDGWLTEAQLRLWRRTYSLALHRYIMREPDDEAARHAAAVAWIVAKAAGAKTKLGTFGQRVAGVDYQILVSTGILRRSLLPGEMVYGQDVSYRPAKGQEFDDQGGQLVVGTLVPYAKYHHHGKGKRQRRLWPQTFPADWWRQITDSVVSGLVRIGDLYGGLAT